MAKHQRGNISTKLLVSWISRLLPDHHDLLVLLTRPHGQIGECRAQQERAFLGIQPRQQRQKQNCSWCSCPAPETLQLHSHPHIAASSGILSTGILLCKGLPSSHLHTHGPQFSSGFAQESTSSPLQVSLIPVGLSKDLLSRTFAGSQRNWPNCHKQDFPLLWRSVVFYLFWEVLFVALSVWYCGAS